MKKILHTLCLISALASSNLFAQVEPAAPTRQRHVGARDGTTWQTGGVDLSPIPLGTQENPVTIAEYCAFLNAMAPSDCGYIGSSYYYESSFMSTDWDWSSSPNACIHRTGWSSHYKYTVVPGCEDVIVDSIHAIFGPPHDIRGEFNAWRKNPTVAELYDYINMMVQYKEDQDESHLKDARAIKDSYPHASQTIFQTADITAQNIHDQQQIVIEVPGLSYQVLVSPFMNPNDPRWIYRINVISDKKWMRPLADDLMY